MEQGGVVQLSHAVFFGSRGRWPHCLFHCVFHLLCSLWIWGGKKLNKLRKAPSEIAEARDPTGGGCDTGFGPDCSLKKFMISALHHWFECSAGYYTVLLLNQSKFPGSPGHPLAG